MSGPPIGGSAARGPLLSDYLDTLAAEQPAPGGGSATGLVGAVAAALVSMVARYTVGRPKFAEAETQVRAALDEAEALRERLMALAEEDAAAYEAVAAARKRPRKTDAEKAARRAAVQDATRAAVTPPLEMAAACRRALELSGIVAHHGNHLLASDAGVAVLFSEAALRASAINVRVNLASIDDAAFTAQAEARLHALLDGASAMKEEIVTLASRRMVGE